MVLKMSPPAPDPPTERSIKVAAYVVGGIVASATIAAIVVIPEAVRFHAKGPPNTGHDALACSDCHKDAPGTMRQRAPSICQYGRSVAPGIRVSEANQIDRELI
jgi:hypothetical protein